MKPQPVLGEPKYLRESRIMPGRPGVEEFRERTERNAVEIRIVWDEATDVVVRVGEPECFAAAEGVGKEERYRLLANRCERLAQSIANLQKLTDALALADAELEGLRAFKAARLPFGEAT